MQHIRKAKKDKTTKMTQRTEMSCSRYILWSFGSLVLLRRRSRDHDLLPIFDMID